MALWQTDILGRKYNADKLEKRLASLTDVADAQWLEENVPAAMQHHSWRSALGSIGGGNHFAELQQVDRIVDADSFALSGLQKAQLLLLVHSGSRGLGQAILRRHVEAFSHNGLPEDSDDARRYLAEHDDALAFARSNRALIARRILQQLRLRANRGWMWRITSLNPVLSRVRRGGCTVKALRQMGRDW